MKFLSASDSPRGTLSSERITQPLETVAEQAFPGYETAGVPMADDGEGTIGAVILVLNSTYRRLTVHGPLMEEARSFYGEFEGGSAIIEIATASGLPTAPAGRHNSLNTTTYSTGELIKDTLDQEYRKISVAVGGSATNDGSMGAVRVLGVRFLSDQGNEPGGRDQGLTRVVDINMNRIHPAVSQSRLTVMCDVTDPLTGPDGVTYTLGKQRGGTPEILDVLEDGMIHYAALLKGKLSVDVDKTPGAGAAGGLGVVFCAFLKANLESGINTVLDLTYSGSPLEGTDLVITGEGRVDWQSAFGKVPSGIGERCRERGIPVAAVVGGMSNRVETISDYGIDSIMTTINSAMGIKEAPKRIEELYISAVDRIFKMSKAGMSLGRK